MTLDELGKNTGASAEDGEENGWDELAYGPAFDPEKGVVFPSAGANSQEGGEGEDGRLDEEKFSDAGKPSFEEEEPVVETRIVQPAGSPSEVHAFGEVDLGDDQRTLALAEGWNVQEPVEANVSQFGNMSVTASPEVVRTTIGPGNGERFVVQRRFPWKAILFLTVLSLLGFFVLPQVGCEVPDLLGTQGYLGKSQQKVALSKASAPKVGDLGKKVVEGVKDASRSVAQTAEEVWEGGVDGVIDDVVSVATGSKNAVVVIESAPPGAEIWVGQKSLGVTPFAGNNLLPTGKKEATRLKKKGYRDAVFQLEGGKDVTVKATLKPMPAKKGAPPKSTTDTDKSASRNAAQ